MYTWWLKVFKHSDKYTIALLSLVNKELNKLVRTYKYKLPIGRELARNCDENIVIWYLTERWKKKMHSLKMDHLKQHNINGHVWEIEQYSNLRTLVPANLDVGRRMLESFMVFADEKWSLNYTQIVHVLVSLFKPSIKIGKNYLQLADVLYEFGKCELLCYDYMQLWLYWQYTGWERFAKAIEDLGRKHQQPEDQAINGVRKRYIINVKLYMKQVLLWKQLLSVVVMRNVWKAIKKSIQDEYTSYSGYHLCAICTKHTKIFLKPWYICSACSNMKKGDRERGIKSHLTSANIPFVEEFLVESQDSYRYADFYIPGICRDVIVECDQHQHLGYSKRMEAIRMWDIANSDKLKDRNVCFIRYNPDNYRDGKGVIHTADDCSRLPMLIDVIRIVTNTTGNSRVEVIYINYDGFDHVLKCVPCHDMACHGN